MGNHVWVPVSCSSEGQKAEKTMELVYYWDVSGWSKSLVLVGKDVIVFCSVDIDRMDVTINSIHSDCTKQPSSSSFSSNINKTTLRFDKT